MKKTTSH